MIQFLHLLRMGLEGTFLVFLTPYGWALVAIAWFSAGRAIEHKNWPRSTWGVLAWPLVMSVSCIAWGQAHRIEPDARAEVGPLLRLYGLVGVYLAVGVALVYFNRRARPATAAVLSAGTFPLLGCAFIAAMAVTGRWL